MSTRGPGRLRPPVSDRDHAQGPRDAPVTLVEYGDYECPYCARAHPIVKDLQRRLGRSMCFVFRNFPLTEMHPYAFHAAEAAESVGAHAGESAFWRMHDLMYEHQQDSERSLDDEHLVWYAKQAGADARRVAEDLLDDAFADRVKEDFLSGVRSGVNGTPTFFINGERYDGPWYDVGAFEEVLREAAAGGRVLR
ncbi:MAG TPA: thioredoxin domain-containing protein [Gemmatimonadaceae bacterium]